MSDAPEATGTTLVTYAYGLYDARGYLIDRAPNRIAVRSATPQQAADMLLLEARASTVYVWRDPNVRPEARIDLSVAPDARAGKAG